MTTQTDPNDPPHCIESPDGWKMERSTKYTCLRKALASDTMDEQSKWLIQLNESFDWETAISRLGESLFSSSRTNPTSGK